MSTHILIDTASEKACTSSVNGTSRNQCPCKSAVVYIHLVYGNDWNGKELIQIDL